MNITYIWLAGGALFVIAELVGIHGIGLMFAGLGALATGALIGMHAVGSDNTLIQFVVFFLTTAIWTLVLWKPMETLRNYKVPNNYTNMIGDIAFVGSSGLTKTVPGEVTWAGAIMRAELSDKTSLDTIEAGSQVTIVEIAGNTLIVQPRA